MNSFIQDPFGTIGTGWSLLPMEAQAAILGLVAAGLLWSFVLRPFWGVAKTGFKGLAYATVPVTYGASLLANGLRYCSSKTRLGARWVNKPAEKTVGQMTVSELRQVLAQRQNQDATEDEQAEPALAKEDDKQEAWTYASFSKMINEKLKEAVS